MALKLTDVHIIDRPGYFGSRRREIEGGYTHQFGLKGWQECWQVQDLVLNFEEAVTLYDDAYFFHLARDPFGLARWICSFAECYDSDKDNIRAGVTHDPVASPRHLQDVSVRRALVRLGRWFVGEDLLHIRGPETNGHLLMPGNVPFHRPEWILAEGGPTRPWMQPGSIEWWWQTAKIVVRKPSSGSYCET